MSAFPNIDFLLQNVDYMSTINYLNMDEAEVVPSVEGDFTEKAINHMTAWLSRALQSQKFIPLPEPLSEYNALVDKGDDGLVCSIYGPPRILPPEVLSKMGRDIPEEGVRLLIFGVALENGESLWNLFAQGFYIGDTVIQMPAEPWVAVMPYQMYPYMPRPELLTSFQKCVARSLLEMSKIPQ